MAVWTDDSSFLTGAVRKVDLVYLSAALDQHADEGVGLSFGVIWYQGKFSAIEIEDQCVAIAIAQQPTEQGVFVGLAGKVFCIGSGEEHWEQISGPKMRGPLRCARSIAGKVYAAGMDRQVYRRDERNNWVACDQGAKPKKSNEDTVTGFEGIDGFAANDIYAVGWNGEIWHYDGKRWRQIESPTNIILTNICCAGDGKVYACGRVGTLLRGRGDEWEVIEHDSIDKDIWGLAWYQDTLYVATRTALFTLNKKDKLKVVRFEDDIPGSFYHLSAADGVLWSIGTKDVMAYDGSEWSRIE